MKNQKTYCFFTQSCSSEVRKSPFSASSYLCCHECKNKSCEFRCKDSLETCKYKVDLDALMQHNRFIKSEEPIVPQAIKMDKSREVDFIKSMMIKFSVSYDRVAYLLLCKHLTPDKVEEVLEKLKK